mgnify:FL=1
MLFRSLINITLSLSDINNIINTSNSIIAELGKKGKIDQLKSLRLRVSGLKSTSSNNVKSWGNSIEGSNKKANSVLLEFLEEKSPKDIINSVFEFYNKISNDDSELRSFYLPRIVFSKNAKKINFRIFIRIYNAYVNLKLFNLETDKDFPHSLSKDTKNYIIQKASQWLFNFVLENKGDESEISFFKEIILGIDNPVIKLFFKIQSINEFQNQDNYSIINSLFLECYSTNASENSFLILNFFEKLIVLNMYNSALEFCNKFTKKEFNYSSNSYSRASYFEDWVLNSITLSLLQNGAYDKAINTVQKIQDHILKANSLIIILENLNLINTEIISNKIFQMFCKNAAEIEDTNELIKVYNSLFEKIIIKDFDLDFIIEFVKYMYELKYNINNKNLLWCKVFLASASLVENEKNIKLKGLFIKRAYAQAENLNDKFKKIIIKYTLFEKKLPYDANSVSLNKRILDSKAPAPLRSVRIG